MAAALNEKTPVEHESRYIEHCCRNEEGVITRETKRALRKMVTNKSSTMVEEALEDILRTQLHHAQSIIQSVVYKIVEQVMLDLPCKDVLDEMLDAQIAKLLHTAVDVQVLSNRLRGC